MPLLSTRGIRRPGTPALLFVLAALGALVALGACSDSATEVEHPVPQPLPQRGEIGDTVIYRMETGAATWD